jgi:hypothetical protein
MRDLVRDHFERRAVREPRDAVLVDLTRTEPHVRVHPETARGDVDPDIAADTIVRVAAEPVAEVAQRHLGVNVRVDDHAIRDWLCAVPRTIGGGRLQHRRRLALVHLDHRLFRRRGPAARGPYPTDRAAHRERDATRLELERPLAPRTDAAPLHLLPPVEVREHTVGADHRTELESTVRLRERRGDDVGELRLRDAGRPPRELGFRRCFEPARVEAVERGGNARFECGDRGDRIVRRGRVGRCWIDPPAADRFDATVAGESHDDARPDHGMSVRVLAKDDWLRRWLGAIRGNERRLRESDGASIVREECLRDLPSLPGARWFRCLRTQHERTVGVLRREPHHARVAAQAVERIGRDGRRHCAATAAARALVLALGPAARGDEEQREQGDANHERLRIPNSLRPMIATGS